MTTLYADCMVFQSTLPRRERRENLDKGLIVGIFQSTLPRRERRRRRVGGAGLSHFNPRSREGSDMGKVDAECQAGISIHAPAKGAT